MLGGHGIGIYVQIGFRILQHRREIEALMPEVQQTVQTVLKLAPRIRELGELIAPELFLEARTGRAAPEPTYTVKWLQQQLKAQGFDPGVLDGFPGPRTTEAVTAFQQANGLVPDGLAGPLTMAKLEELQAPRAPRRA